MAQFQDIKITGIIEEGITTPRNDGTHGSSLYSIPFSLSKQPPEKWADRFIANWNEPSSYTSMHRPGIAEIDGDTITLNGTAIEEVEKYHRKTLLLAIKTTNQEYRQWLLKQEQIQKQEQIGRDKHRQHVKDIAKRIKFD